MKLKVFTPRSEREDELLSEDGVLEQAQRVARGFVSRRGRQRDMMFKEEMEAEAAFLATEILWEEYVQLKERIPDIEERHRFIRKRIGYGLLEYVSHRASSTISYLKKKGIVEEHVVIRDSHLCRCNDDIECMIALESVTADELERCVVQYHAMGNPRDLIASKCGLTRNRVKKILSRVRRRLKFPSDN